MKKHFLTIISSLVLLTSFCGGATAVYSEGVEETTENSISDTAITSISITPLSKVLTLNSGKTYEDSFTVTNNGGTDMVIETYAAPYSYVYSESEDNYKLGFNNENSFTQISRWITFQDTNGSWVEKANFTISPSSSLDITYRITTPDSIPAGGQYAVIFAHTLTATTTSSGIRTEASPGIIVYGRSLEGETVVGVEISDLDLNKTTDADGETKNLFSGSAKVKNTGNTDFVASGTLKVTGLFGDTKYETDSSTGEGKASVIPEAELEVSDEWEETPDFGFFRVSWTVTAGDKTEKIEKVFILLSPIAIIISIIVLTILIVGIIILVKKRKEHRSRCAI